MSFIGKCWRGQERLWKVFWLYGILFPIFLSLFLLLIDRATIHVRALWAGQALRIPFIILCVPYMIWHVVSLWRCAFNANWTFYGYAARVYVILPGLIIIYLIVLGVFTGLEFIHGFTDAVRCQKIIQAEMADQEKINQEAAARAGVDYKTYRVQHPKVMSGCSGSSFGGNSWEHWKNP